MKVIEIFLQLSEYLQNANRGFCEFFPQRLKTVVWSKVAVRAFSRNVIGLTHSDPELLAVQFCGKTFIKIIFKVVYLRRFSKLI